MPRGCHCRLLWATVRLHCTIVWNGKILPKEQYILCKCTRCYPLQKIHRCQYNIEFFAPAAYSDVHSVEICDEARGSARSIIYRAFHWSIPGSGHPRSHSWKMYNMMSIIWTTELPKHTFVDRPYRFKPLRQHIQWFANISRCRLDEPRIFA